MKKLFHLGMVTFLAIAISSCSKSKEDLNIASTEKLTRTGNFSRFIIHATPLVTVNPNSVWGLTNFYGSINQPQVMPLADPANSMLYASSGQFAVFYLLVDGQLTSVPGGGILELTDETTDIKTPPYKMLPDYLIADYPVTPPSALAGQRFMFGIVPLSELTAFDGHQVKLYAEAYTDIDVYSAELLHAFTFYAQ